MKIKRKEIFGFNIDKIEIYWTIKWIYEKAKELDKLKESEWWNIKEIEFLWYTLEKDEKAWNCDYKIIFKKNDINVFTFYKWRVAYITTYDHLIVQWKCFRVNSNEEIYNFITNNIDETSIKAFQLKRFDLALDIKRNLPDWILKYCKKLKQKWSNFYWDWWSHQSHYRGEKKNRKNRRFLLRFYDKKDDILEKWLQDLYPEYLLEENITRIEIEFRPDLCWSVKIDEIFNLKYSFNLLLKYLKKHTEIFEWLKTMDVEKLKSKKYTVDLDRLSTDSTVRERYLRAFLWYARRLLKAWICPTDVMISNFLILPKTENRISLMPKFDAVLYTQLSLWNKIN